MLNVHSQKLSGLANTKAIHVTTDPEGGLVIVTKDASKSPNKVQYLSARHLPECVL